VALTPWISGVEEEKKGQALSICAEGRFSLLIGQAAWEGDGDMQNCCAR
jgi:hypothetical protein